MSESIQKVLFVCLGNICRSPAAEGVFLYQIAASGLTQKYKVDSAATGAWHIGSRPDPRMIEAASRRQIHLPSIGRQIQADDFQNFDWIIPMDEKNYTDLLKLCPPNLTSRIRPMKEFIFSKSVMGVPDPYFGGPEGFEEVLDLLEEGCQNLLLAIEKK